jgi:hypothetical protein
MQAAEAEGAEDSEQEEDDAQDRPRTIPDGSAGKGGWSWPDGLKAEPSSNVPGTQQPPQSSEVIDLGDPDEEDEDEE